jgi:hypothetical protein
VVWSRFRLAIAVSIIAHSMSDVPAAKVFDVEEMAGLPPDVPDVPDVPSVATTDDGTVDDPGHGEPRARQHGTTAE